MSQINRSELAAILRRTLDGDSGALDSLLTRLRPYLRLLVWKQRRGPRDGDDSDLVQETLLRVQRHFGATRREGERGVPGDDPSRFLAWIAAVTRNVVADDVRHRHAEKRDEDREARGSALLDGLAAGSTPEQRALREERAVVLAEAIDRLPPHQQDVLRLRFFDRLSFKEIGERTGKSEGALRILCLRAMRALAEDGPLRREMETLS